MSRRAQSIIGHERCVCSFRKAQRVAFDRGARPRRKGDLRFAIDAKNLLFGRVRPTREISGLRGRHPFARGHDRRCADSLAAESFEQRAASRILPHDAYRHNSRAEVCEIIDGVRRASRIELRAAVAQNQDRSLARHARDLARCKLVEHEITDDADGLLRESSHYIEQAAEIDA
jgi:hypothetical protein